MTNTSKTIVFFGNERLVSGLRSTEAPVLQSLISSGYTIAAIVSHHSDGQSRSNRTLEVAEIANEYGIPVLLPNRPSEIKDILSEYDAVAGVLVAYGRIIPQDIIDIFPKGIINIHPSLLPLYRGSTPIESAILNGDNKTGISIMQLSAGMDEGPVYSQVSVSIGPNETKFDLYTTLSILSAKLLIDTLPSILNESIEPHEQDSSKATYTKLLSKADAKLTPQAFTAQELERQVRAYLGFPKSKITILNKDIIITKAHVSQEPKTPLSILCKDGEYLEIDELIGPSGKTMSSTAFLNGYSI